MKAFHGSGLSAHYCCSCCLYFSIIATKKPPRIPYTWLLISIVGSVVIVQMLYWIGSQRYSTRYYYEALSAAALITAIPFAWLIRKGLRIIASPEEKSKNRPSSAKILWYVATYGAFLALCLFTLYNYSTPRIMALYRFNGISPELIDDVKSYAQDDSPILAIVAGESSGDDRVRWRSYAALMAVTSPYLDSEIVAARDYGSSRQQFFEEYPDRQVVDVLRSRERCHCTGNCTRLIAYPVN